MSLLTTIEQYSYEYLLNLALNQVSNQVDTREGSIIYDAIAPACYVLAEAFQEMSNLVQATYVLTATEQDLENRVIERGLTRREASAAVKLATFTKQDNTAAEVPLGSRFSSISDTEPLVYVITEAYTNSSGVVVPGSYRATCETPGTAGHNYVGNILPLDYLPYLKTAALSTTLVSGEDVETDDELRARYLDKISVDSFGGNIAEYRELLISFGGVGACQIYPVWNGGGTVKVSIIDGDYGACDPSYVTQVQTEIDPEHALATPSTGLGLAPINHKVTVVTATEVDCDVSATVTLVSGQTISQVRPLIVAALEEYLLTLRKSWGEGSALNEYGITLYISQITRAILSVAGVANATNVMVNNSSNDIVFTENSTTQQLPVLGEVTLNGQ